ncbi:hypothetical protein QUF75_15635 [Desulfococcaceae bacterium HSG7]|nr:hypothetical protein [Desulfococcaceae bacterium HSG7]
MAISETDKLNIDNDALTLFLLKSLGMPHKSGFGKLNTIPRMTEDVPDTFKYLLDVVKYSGDRFYEEYLREDRLSGRRPTINFWPEPYVHINDSFREQYNLGDEKEIDPQFIRWASYYVSASNKFTDIGDPDWMYIESGFWFKIFVETPQKDAELEYEVYSSIYSNGYDEEIHTSHKLSRFKKSGFIKKKLIRITMDDLYDQILETLPETLENTIDQYNDNAKKRILRKLQERLE